MIPMECFSTPVFPYRDAHFVWNNFNENILECNDKTIEFYLHYK